MSPARCEIRDGEQVFRLQPRVMQVLVLLHSRKGQVTTKEDLILHCWYGAAVTDDSITRVISQLRKLSKDLGGDVFAIRTIPKVGYAFELGDIVIEDGEDQGVASDQPVQDAPRSNWRPALLAIPLVIVALVIGWWQFGARDAWSFGTLQPLNLEGDIQSHPAVSADGLFIVYSATRGSDNRDLWMARSTGGVATRLTTHPDIDHQAAFSPSGDRLVFVRSTFDDAARPCRIIVLDLSDLRETIVSRCKSASFRISTPAWSPDEKSLYLSEAVTASPDSVIRLVELDLETGERTPLTEPREAIRGDYDPKISPDGTKLIFRRATDFRSGKHFMLDLTDNSLVKLTGEGRFRVYEWTPDGEQILLLAPDEGAGLTAYTAEGELIEQRSSGLLHPLLRMSRGDNLLAAEVSIQSSVIIDQRGGSTTELASARNNQRLLTISSQDVLAFMTADEESSTVWLVEDGSPPRRFVDLPSINVLTWSPDGTELAYATVEGDKLGVININDEKPREMAWDGRIIGSMAWNPDGQSLIFAVQTDAQWHLWTVPASLESQANQWSAPGWWAVRSNSNAIFATRADEPGIWRMSQSGEPIDQFETTFASGQSIGRTIDTRNGFVVTETQVFFHRNGADVGANGSIMAMPIGAGDSAVRQVELEDAFSDFSAGQDGRIVHAKRLRDHFIVTLQLEER
ncbi:winged helix-turn-helix domain-containing protein [Erythrobacter sp. Alg231-14]|uniref:winged helix-turn-helix domain-containing protein n=1 Tax=Erythrobacter sp. Alg231-14 TaxID=1922225 RepID=UPI000D562B9E